MHYEHDDAGDGHIVHTAISEPNAQTLRQDRRGGSFTVTIGDVDLPAFVSHGVLYLEAPLGRVFEAFAENISEFLRDMEVRISDSRGTAFSLDSNGHPVSIAGLAEPRVVRNSGWRR